MEHKDIAKEKFTNELEGLPLHVEDNGSRGTGRRQADDTLKVSETRYRRLFESAQNGILLLDAYSGQIIDVNPFLLTMLGYSHKDFMGKKLWEIGSFSDIAASRLRFSELQTKGYVRYEHLPLQTKDSRLIDVDGAHGSIEQTA